MRSFASSTWAAGLSHALDQARLGDGSASCPVHCSRKVRLAAMALIA